MSSTKNEAIRRRNDPRDKSSLRKSEKTRQVILDAALKLLWSHPFRDLTIAKLMSETGITRPAFYQYFSDLHDLMQNLLDDLEHEIQEVAGPWFSGEGESIQSVAETMLGVVKVCYQRGPLVRAVVEAAGVQDVLTKCIGSNNPNNMVRATIEALLSLRAPEEVARARGKQLDELDVA